MFFSHEVRPFGRGPTTWPLGDIQSPWLLTTCYPKPSMGLEYVPTFATRIKRIFVGLIFTKNSMVINQKLGWSSKTKVLTFIETMCPGRFTGHRGWGTFLLEILVAKMVVTIPLYYICIYTYIQTPFEGLIDVIESLFHLLRQRRLRGSLYGWRMAFLDL